MKIARLFNHGSISKNEHSADCALLLEGLFSKKHIGFYNLTRMDHLWSETETIGSRFAKQFEKFVWVGIGGSSLGPKAMAEALRWKHIKFIENPDIQTLLDLKKELGDLAKVGFVFVSKSGTTIETLATLDFFNQELILQNKDISKQTVVITEKKSSSLYDWACGKNIPVLEIPINVGGRFSVLSSVGQLLIKLGNGKLEEFKKGAEHVFNKDYQNQVLFPLVDFFASSIRKKDALVYFWYYSDSCYQLGKWLEQLWAESLGKKESPLFIAPAPIACLGANDQHSILQQLMETQLSKSVVVHRSKNSEHADYQITSPLFSETKILANKAFTELLKTEAHAMTDSQIEMNHHVSELYLDTMNEFELGQYFMTYQLVVGMLGEFLKIDAFNQPGVELGKIITKKLLARLS